MGFETSRTKADGFVVLLNGMSGGVSPFLIKEGFFSKGINVSIRGGLVSTRPGFKFVSKLGEKNFQGCGRWSLNSGDYIVYGTDGQIKVFDIDKNVIHNIVGSDVDKTITPLYFAQIDRWFIVQDGINRPVVLDFDAAGKPILYGRNPPEVCYVPGTVGQYAHLRYHYVPTFVPDMSPDPSQADVMPGLTDEPGRMGFVSSDVRDTLNPEYVFRMSEHRSLNEGGHITLPAEMGFIHGMAVFRNAATGTGVGPLVVFGREGVCAFDTNVPRAQWKSVNIGQPLFMGAGTRSPYAIINVNDDIFYLDTDSNLRSLKYDISAGHGGVLSNVPISNELAPFIEKSNLVDLPLASMALADNRILFTLCGIGAGYFRGLGSLDIATMQAFMTKSPAAYDGLWTGFKFLRVVAARKNNKLSHFVVVATDKDSGFALLELSNTEITDNGTPIECQLQTGYYVFQSANLKQLKFCDIWLSDIRSDIEMSIYYRTTSYPVWSLIGTKRIVVPSNSGPQARRRLRFSLDITDGLYNPISKEKLYNGHEFQFCLKWTGWCKIVKFQAQVDLLADDLPNNFIEDNAENEVFPMDDGLDDFSYKVTL